MKRSIIVGLLTMGIALGSICYSYAEGEKNANIENIPIKVKIVLPKEGKDSKEYKYDFNVAEGKEFEYENGTTLPYTVKGKNEEAVNFIEVKTKVSLKPHIMDKKVVLHSQIESCQNIAKSEADIPVIKCIKHKGISVHEDKEFLKIFSEDHPGLEQPIDVYIKVAK